MGPPTSGEAPIKWEDWSIGTGATLGQTVYSDLLSTAPAEGDLLAKTRDRELYFMFKKALYQGAAYHLVERTSAAESGHKVWKDLHEWFGSAEVSRTVIDYYRNKLNSLRLTQTSEANDYINEYQCYNSTATTTGRHNTEWSAPNNQW